ncbi:MULTISPECIES: FtsW/RodA/SpoVE family cell cycle protein [Leptospira]|uniref:Probable peptidoglycan glycosyltransferase FtsW n=3 Tax=Leptospira weilii TaxID=28184 RepID=A0A828Z5H3_9LEPT|nr:MULTISPECIES: putative peptidoglycan glycosyltransferase FtsW [Leptospira]EMM72221.1 cell cycle protein, FtsW/RodA/SpoVE family [Leptospira weilii str. 2006001855]EKR65643.1 cell cycle protein, FtsW/RodA/SpoVE family [Leptospira weilii str. 2006001853]EMJ59749.1 cell cycle protein, FtsW/RodA/SpoVE family [Leptospira sp. P2653]EMN46548.1 cell cycle protein, FtsW/RodA/SpoVE family [Leptospira weilii str. LNT 1234]EMN90021.1 cell cycle protein, FtsW/RodA/SpoVE family [Leptospira weilii str. UI
MTEFIARKWKEIWLPGKNSLDILLIVTIFILLFSGLCVMYSSSSISAWREFKDSEYFLKKQAIWICIGLVFFFFFSVFPYQKLEKLALVGMIAAIGLLVSVFIPGVGKSVSTYYGRNFHRWIAIGPYQLQPSEVAKVAVLIYLSSLFQKLKSAPDYKKLLIPALFLLTVIVLILIEPAFGTTLEILFVILGFIFLFGVPFRNLLAIGIVSLPLIYVLIDRVGYRKKRVEVWLDPYRYRFDEGHQLVTSFRAFLDGGWFGNKLASGYAHRYLTYSHTDFVLATFVEDFGFFGFLTFIFLILLLLFRSFYLVQKVKDPFGFYLGAGILIILGTQFIINMFVVTGIFPITGISLPFVSYGGSSILIVLISLGILVNITRKENLGL